jgi:hypothetical protein
MLHPHLGSSVPENNTAVTASLMICCLTVPGVALKIYQKNASAWKTLVYLFILAVALN